MDASLERHYMCPAWIEGYWIRFISIFHYRWEISKSYVPLTGNLTELLSGLGSLPFIGGQTMLELAVRDATQQLFNVYGLGRPGVPKVNKIILTVRVLLRLWILSTIYRNKHIYVVFRLPRALPECWLVWYAYILEQVPSFLRRVLCLVTICSKHSMPGAVPQGRLHLMSVSVLHFYM